jgi:hypothetical protein
VEGLIIEFLGLLCFLSFQEVTQKLEMFLLILADLEQDLISSLPLALPTPETFS